LASWLAHSEVVVQLDDVGVVEALVGVNFPVDVLDFALCLSFFGKFDLVMRPL